MNNPPNFLKISLEKEFFYSKVYSCLKYLNSYFKGDLLFTFKFTNKYNVNYRVNRIKHVNLNYMLFTLLFGEAQK